ncbi:hypothetical protein Tco_0207955, partial [Tanacetum coccineum]
LAAEMQAEIEKEERIRRKKEEEANLALIELWENKQAMMEADRLLKKHFAELRAKEKRNRPPTKAQKRNQMSTYLKNIGTWKHNQLKSKTYEEIERLFKIEMKRVNTFIPMDQEVESSKKDEAENKSKRAGEVLESNKTKKQKLDEQEESDKHEEVEKDDDLEEDEMKKHMQIVIDEDIAIDVIPLSTKPPMIVEYKIIKEGIFGHFQLIRADGSSKRYS